MKIERTRTLEKVVEISNHAELRLTNIFHTKEEIKFHVEEFVYIYELDKVEKLGFYVILDNGIKIILSITDTHIVLVTMYSKDGHGVRFTTVSRNPSCIYQGTSRNKRKRKRIPIGKKIALPKQKRTLGKNKVNPFNNEISEIQIEIQCRVKGTAIILNGQIVSIHLDCGSDIKLDSCNIESRVRKASNGTYTFTGRYASDYRLHSIRNLKTVTVESRKVNNLSGLPTIKKES